MYHYKLTIITILLLTLSFNGMAQKKQSVSDANPQEPKPEIVKVERINDQDILTVASSSDTIRILWSEDNKSIIERMMQSSVGTGRTIKDIEGADVHILRVKKNMKLGIYFRNKMRSSISITDEELSILTPGKSRDHTDGH
jgi:hypothetical protein